MAGIRILAFSLLLLAFERVSGNADSIEFTPQSGTLPGCGNLTLYCVFKSTNDASNTWEIDVDEKGYCVNRNAWTETGESLYPESYLNSLSCPLSPETLAVIQSVTETDLISSNCNVTEKRPSSVTLIQRTSQSFSRISSDYLQNQNQSCSDDLDISEEACLKTIAAEFLRANSSSNYQGIDCEAAQNAIAFRIQPEAAKGTPGFPLCGGTKWTIRRVQIGMSIPAEVVISSPNKACTANVSNPTCNLLTSGGSIQSQSRDLADIIGAEQEPGEFEVLIKTVDSDLSFRGETFDIELSYDDVDVLTISVLNARSEDSKAYFAFVIEPSKGIYKIVNEFI
ncbi:uncharacterized protein [Oscarella lobularis]|uniref:uncharacterized protein n=1 Tax=Oscarella lobularis TaxID=121494 RepID=UPI003313A75E